MSNSTTITSAEKEGLSSVLFLTDAEIETIEPGKNDFADPQRWGTTANPEGCINIYFETDVDETAEKGRLVAFANSDRIYPI
jgi:hypothetical protein